MRVTSLFFLDSQTGWAAGIYGTILKTSNGGVSFSENAPGVTVSEFQLYQNYPNPFNPATTIRYSISQENFVSIKVYNLLGEEVAALVNDYKIPGSYNIIFNAASLSSGVYFYKISAGEFSKNKKMILVK